MPHTACTCVYFGATFLKKRKMHTYWCYPNSTVACRYECPLRDGLFSARSRTFPCASGDYEGSSVTHSFVARVPWVQVSRHWHTICTYNLTIWHTISQSPLAHNRRHWHTIFSFDGICTRGHLIYNSDIALKRFMRIRTCNQSTGSIACITCFTVGN
jgi:hypothetical protein